MKPNIGTIDRIIRIALGLGLIAFGIITHNWLGAIGVIPLLTAFFRFCPVYCPLRINTIGKDGNNGQNGCGGGKCC